MSDTLGQSGPTTEAQPCPVCGARGWKHRLRGHAPNEEAQADLTACIRLLRSDLFRLNPGPGAEYDCVTRWEYVNPGFKVVLYWGERNLLGSVYRCRDGEHIASTTHASAEWLDEVLP